MASTPLAIIPKVTTKAELEQYISAVVEQAPPYLKRPFRRSTRRGNVLYFRTANRATFQVVLAANLVSFLTRSST